MRKAKARSKGACSLLMRGIHNSAQNEVYKMGNFFNTLMWPLSSDFLFDNSKLRI
jgi:hypothetical protein